MNAGEAMKQCPQCNRRFPDELIQQMCLNGKYIPTCPICALRIRNKMHGLPKREPYQGKIANQLLGDAIQSLAERDQPVPKWAQQAYLAHRP